MFLYRLLLIAAAPVFALRLARERRHMAERLGGGGRAERARGPVIWLHAASNGELTSARGLIERLLGRWPDAAMLVTCNSLTGRALVRDWRLARVTTRLAPFDYRWTLRRFIDRFRPDMLILIESELWPNRILEMAAQGRPVLLIGARMSARSAARWGKLPGLVRPMLTALSHVSAQDPASRARYVALGADPARVGPDVNLKTTAAPALADHSAERAGLVPLFPRAATLLAASTHLGEERIVLRGFAAARAQNPELRLIIAPRHPRRAPEIAAEIAGAGLACTTRSRGELPRADIPVYLADTMGEMPLWYALAGLTFVGGSLVARGGHTPFEPAAHGSAILHGPDVANFADAYATLDRVGAARCVDGAAALTRALLDLDGAAQAAMAALAAQTIDALRNGGAGLDTLVETIDAFLSAAEDAPRKEPRP